MLAAAAVEGHCQDELLAVFDYLNLPLATPLLKNVFADDRFAAIHTDGKSVAAVGGDRPHRDYGDAEADGVGMIV